MYSISVVRSKLNTIQNKINLLPASDQFTLKLYSVAEVQQYKQHFNSITVTEGKEAGKAFTRDLYPDEINFIKSERIICKHYWRYWAERYSVIKSRLGHSSSVELDTDDALMLWRANNAQKVVLKILAELDERQLPLMLLFLKARQLGVSTMVELLTYHRINFYSNLTAYVASADPDKSSKMTGMMVLVKDKHPFWLSPTIYHTTSSELLFRIPELNNTVIKEHGSPKKTGIATGDTPDIIHLSEVSRYTNPHYDIDAALIKAFHPNPMSLFVMESTADGDTGWWWETWKFAEENWSKGLADFCPIFLGWFLGTDLYPTPAWLKQKNHAFVQWEPKPDTIAHKLKVEQYVRNSPVVSTVLGANYTLPREQQFFYEVDRASYAAKSNLYNFLQEMPATPKEAFQSPTGTAFPVEIIDRLRNYARPLATYQGAPAVFAIMGDGIEVEHQPLMEEIDTSRIPIPIKVDLANGSAIRNYRLVPLLHLESEWNRRLFIYELPFPHGLTDQEYSNGIDVGGGLGQDRTISTIIKKGQSLTPSEQVAEYAANDLNGDEFIPMALALSHFYSYFSDDVSNQCLLSIELNFGGGASMQHQLRLMGYNNFYRWQGSLDNLKQGQSNKIGWVTNERTRSWLVNDVRRDIRNGFLIINSPYCIDECQSLVDNGRIEAKLNCFDDRFFALGIAHFTQSGWDIRHRAENVNPDLAYSLAASSRTALRFQHPMQLDIDKERAKLNIAAVDFDKFMAEAARLGCNVNDIVTIGGTGRVSVSFNKDMRLVIEGEQ